MSSFKHLGNNISNQNCFTNQDIIVKRAVYINKCIELNQEFYFADPFTKLKICEIYNGHYTGSPLWDLFGSEAVHLESSYNRNVKIVFDLPLATHRNLIEPVTRRRHLRIIRFKSFIEQLKKLAKLILK